MAATFDLVVVGGGPAGYTSAIKGALQGFKVALIERAEIGGACVHRGCIPTKALWGTAVSLQRLKDLEENGISTKSEFVFDYGIAAKRQFEISRKMATTLKKRMEDLGVQILFGNAYFQRKNTENLFEIEVRPLLNDGVGAHQKTIIQSRFALLCTGSRPSESGVLKSDHQHVLNTDDFVLMSQLPKSVAIVGGGVVACEFASILNKFGVKVHLLEHSSQVLSSMDQEVVAMLAQYFKEDGITVHCHTKVQDLKIQNAQVHLTLANSKENSTSPLAVERVLLAIGRKPNSEDLGLENIGAVVSDRGNLVVNDQLQSTTCQGLYGAGDVVGGPMLAHKAWYDAEIALRGISGEECKKDYDIVPGAIFTIPEMASVGLQPDQARQKGHNVAIGKFLFSENAQAMCVGKTRGIVKAVVDRDTGAILGCTMLGHDSSNLISEVALAMRSKLTVNAIAETIHPHPTLSEMIWEAFLDTQGRSIHQV